jgi:uncharacterized protein DUF6263
MKKIVCFIGFVLVAFSVSAQKVQPQLSLVKGETYYQNMSVDSDIEQNFNGTEMKMTMNMAMKLSYRVIDVANGVFNLEARYQKMLFSMNTGQGIMEFDSEKKSADDVFSSMMGALIDKPFTIKINAAGMITEVKGTDELFKQAMNQFDALDEDQKQQMSAQLQQSYGEGAIKKNMESSFRVYPEKMISKGEKWTVDTQLEAGGNADIKTIYELTDITPEYYVLKGTAVISTASGKGAEAAQMSDISGTVVSDIKLNRKTGWAMSATIKQDIKGNVNAAGNTIPIVMKNVMTISDH